MGTDLQLNASYLSLLVPIIVLIYFFGRLVQRVETLEKDGTAYHAWGTKTIEITTLITQIRDDIADIHADLKDLRARINNE